MMKCKNILITMTMLCSLLLCACSESKYEINQTVMLGTYEQDGDSSNGAEPIEWIVLDIKDNRALLLSKYVLDTCAFHEQLDNVSWNTSSIYKMLNDDFYNESFNDKEKKQIIMSVEEETSEEYGYVFFLSCEEAIKFFDMYSVSEEDYTTKYMYDCYYSQKALGVPTEYVHTKYNEITEFREKEFQKLLKKGIAYEENIIGEDYSSWWLRELDDGYDDSAYYVSNNGSIGITTRVSQNSVGMRPAMWVKVK